MFYVQIIYLHLLTAANIIFFSLSNVDKILSGPSKMSLVHNSSLDIGVPCTRDTFDCPGGTFILYKRDRMDNDN